MDTPASDQALAVVELLERILLNLGMKDLFLKQRVCKTWQSCIQNSPALKRKMFLMNDGEPLRPSSVPLSLPDIGQLWVQGQFPPHTHIQPRAETLHLHQQLIYRTPDIRLNPAVKAIRWGGIGHRLGAWGDKFPPAALRRDKRSFANFHISFRTPPYIGTHHQGFSMDKIQLVINVQPLAQRLSKLRPTSNSPNASWKKMFITQPPVTAIELFRTDSPNPDLIISPITLYNPKGLTFGALHDSPANISHDWEEQHSVGGFVFDLADDENEILVVAERCESNVGRDKMCKCIRQLMKG